MKKITKRRIWKWKYLIGKQFFSTTVVPGGFFTVKKIWEYKITRDNIQNFDGTHVFDYHTVLIVTDEGMKLIIPKLLLDIDKAFEKSYPKKKR